MIYSKIGICNLALAAIGEDSIRDFSEGNKRARMCESFYDVTRDYLLSQFVWPFARRQAELNRLASPPDWSPEGVFAYELPKDCHQPTDLWPEGSRQQWEVRGRALYTRETGVPRPVVLIYNRVVLDPTELSSQFVNLLALAISVRVCMPLTQDKDLTRTVFQQYEVEKREAWATDASIGSNHVHSDDDPNKDSFVDADWALHSDGLN